MGKGPTLTIMITLQAIIVLHIGLVPFPIILVPPDPFISGTVPTDIISPDGLFPGEFSLDTLIPEGKRELYGPDFYWKPWTKLQTTLILS